MEPEKECETTSLTSPSKTSLPTSSSSTSVMRRRSELRARTRSRVGCIMDPLSKKSYLASIESLTDADGEIMSVMMIHSPFDNDIHEEEDESSESSLVSSRKSPGVKQLCQQWESKSREASQESRTSSSSRNNRLSNHGLKLDLSPSRMNGSTARSASFCCRDSPNTPSSSSSTTSPLSSFVIPHPCSRKPRERRNSTLHGLERVNSLYTSNVGHRKHRTPSFRLISRSSSSASSSGQSSTDSGIMSSSLSLISSSNSSCNDSRCHNDDDHGEVLRRHPNRHPLNHFFTRDSLLHIDMEDEDDESSSIIEDDEGVVFLDSSPTSSTLLLDMFLSSSSSSSTTSSTSTLAENSSPVSSPTPSSHCNDSANKNPSVHPEVSVATSISEGASSQPITTNSQTNVKYIERVIMELVDTEKSYLKDLEDIVEGYMKHLMEVLPSLSSTKLTSDSICELFGNIEDVFHFSQSFLSHLESCELNPTSIAKTFVREFDENDSGFDVYTHYCAVQFPITLRMLSDLMSDQETANILLERQVSLEHSLPLGSYLLKPVQRILKYPLLLQSIAKHTDPEDEGYKDVCEAVDTMINYASHINDMKRKRESVSSEGSQVKVWIWLPLSSKSKQNFHKLLSRKTMMKTLSQASKASWKQLQHRLGKKKAKQQESISKEKPVKMSKDMILKKSASLPAEVTLPVK